MEEFKIGNMEEKKKQEPKWKPGWTVFIDGEEKKVNRIEINSRFGKLVYGLRPEGYDGWVFFEEGGGGVVTVPYSRTPEGELLIALLQENRPNMGGEVWCVTGGFIEAGETYDQAQKRELAEETVLSMTAQKLPGLPTNSNRLFFVADAYSDEGVHAYGLEVPFSLLEKDEDGWKLKSSDLLSGVKKPDNLRFFPWRKAIARSADGIARAAIAQLLAVAL